MSTTDRVIDTIRHLAPGEKQDAITADDHLENDLLFDSLDLVEAVMCIEEEFEIRIDDHDCEDVARVADIVALVDRVRRAAA